MEMRGRLTDQIHVSAVPGDKIKLRTAADREDDTSLLGLGDSRQHVGCLFTRVTNLEGESQGNWIRNRYIESSSRWDRAVVGAVIRASRSISKW
jgi:hypothetical protein